MRKFALVILLVTSVSNIVFAGSFKNNHLEVPYSIFNTPGIVLNYEVQVKEILLKDAPLYPYVQMVVLPSFEAEWMVSIAQPKDGIFQVEYVTVNQQIWANKKLQDIKQIKKSAVIPEALANDINHVWKKMLKNVRYPEQDRLGLDGTTFYFIADDLVGRAWSPQENSLVGMQTSIGELLRDYVLSRKDENILGEIKKVIESINRKL